MLKPLHRWLTAKIGGREHLASLLVIIGIICLVLVPLSLLIGVVVGQALGAGDSRRARHAGLLGLAVGCGAAAFTGAAIGFGAGPLARFYSFDPVVAAAAASLLAIVAVYHLADAVQAVLAQVLRGYKRATVPMVIYALSLWGVGLGGGYLLGLTDSFGAARGAAGFWIAGTASLSIAGAGVLAYFLRVSSQTIPAPATTRA